MREYFMGKPTYSGEPMKVKIVSESEGESPFCIGAPKDSSYDELHAYYEEWFDRIMTGDKFELDDFADNATD